MAIFNELGVTNKGNKIWREAREKNGSVQAIDYRIRKKVELKHAWYAIMDGMVELLSISSLQEAAVLSMEYHSKMVEKLYESLMSTFPVKEALKAKKNRTLWNQIFNYDLDRLDCINDDVEVGRHRCTKELLIDYFENEEENAANSREHAAMDDCL